MHARLARQSTTPGARGSFGRMSLPLPLVADALALRFPTRATAWRLKTARLDLSAGPALMGI
ncbi:MAG: hypothetical protein AAF790_14855, partial [Planctomycetota bacterium]